MLIVTQKPSSTKQRLEVLDHMLNAVASAEVKSIPFPHFAVTELFPTDIYAELLDCLPDGEYRAFSYEKHHNQDGKSNRERFRLENHCLAKLDRRQRYLWSLIRSTLGSTELKELVYEKLSQGLCYRFRCSPDEVRSLSGFALPELFRETAGYRIAPHPDTRKKVVTMQIALARDDSQKELGTEFYRRSIDIRSWYREPRGFEIVTKMPFLPNSAYAFVVLNTIRLKSWHGRTTLPAELGIRDTILNIWYAKPEHGNQELIEDDEVLWNTARVA